jgi:hypothetical protein
MRLGQHERRFASLPTPFADLVAALPGSGVLSPFVAAVWISGHALGFCITPIPYCVQQFLWVVKAGKMP